MSDKPKPKLRVVELETKPTVAARAAIDVLEEWLEKARAGEFVQIAIIGAHADGTVSHANSYGEHMHSLISGMEILKWRLIEEREIV